MTAPADRQPYVAVLLVVVCTGVKLAETDVDHQLLV